MANDIINHGGGPRNGQVFTRADQIIAQRSNKITEKVQARHAGRTDIVDSAEADLNAMEPVAKVVLADLNALARPASVLEMAEHLAVLMDCFPNSATANRATIARVMPEDVADMQPSIGDLEAACRKLRRTLLFFPAIAEVLGALKEAKEHREGITRAIRDIATRTEQQQLERQRELEAERQRQQRQQRQLERRQQFFLGLADQSAKDPNAPFT